MALRKGVETKSAVVYEEPINMEDGWPDEYGHTKEEGYVYNIVDFTQMVRESKPTRLQEYRNDRWEQVAESKFVPGFYLFRTTLDNHARLRAKADASYLAMMQKNSLGGRQVEVSPSDHSFQTDELMKQLSTGL